MSALIFEYTKTSLISNKEIQAIAARLRREIKRSQEYAFCRVPNASLETIETVLADVVSLQPAVVILIGIGGSSLAPIALIQGIFGLQHNKTLATQFFYLDTVATDTTYDILALAQAYLEKKQTVIAVIATKSGTTTETIANAALVLDLLKKYNPTTWQKRVIALTDKNSPLWLLAQQYKWHLVEIPHEVGGRFSALTAVGLIPLGLLKGDIPAARAGAQEMLKKCMSVRLLDNPAIISAALLYIAYRQGKNIHDTFIFDPALESLGKWYRQLMGESIGKKNNLQGDLVETGITPTVSVGSTDLHSVAQLYLAGPRDKFTTFVTVHNNNHVLTIKQEPLSSQMPGDLLTNKTFSEIMAAIFKGTCIAYMKDKRPFVTITLSAKDAYCLGAFMQFKMFEIVFLAFLLDIDPFDQPNVEDYKRETRRLLSE